MDSSFQYDNSVDECIQWAESPLPDTGHLVIHWDLWIEAEARLVQWRNKLEKKTLALRVPADTDTFEVGKHAGYFQVIIVEIDLFTDGRVFSLGRMLRENYHYEGHLHVTGDFLPDQITFLKRCGFDSFSSTNNDSPIENPSYYSHYYQASGPLTTRDNQIGIKRRDEIIKFKMLT